MNAESPAKSRGSTKSRVFISYSSQDRTWADSACASLEQKNIRCWIAPRDITPGTEWGAAIIEGIDQCQVMVLIFSSQADQSAQVRREVERAIGKGLAILPLRIEDIRPHGAMEYALSNTHWLDAFNPPMEQRLNELADSVQALIGTHASASRGASRPAPSAAPRSQLPRARPLVISAALLATLACLAGLGALVKYRTSAAPTPQTVSGATHQSDEASPAEEPDDSDAAADKGSGDEYTDVTEKFNGLWVAVAESLPKAGPLPQAKVDQRRSLIRIQGHEFQHRRRQTQTSMATLSGSATFEAAGDKKWFRILGVDRGRKRHLWLGIYEDQDDALELCFRKNDDSRRPVLRPETMYRGGEVGTFYLKFVRISPQE